ncbi:MAG: type II toxin-antitoxin system HicB family antitoxin [Methanothrix sp.]|nr:type II toxin-antitoxin system HicB family antitoxin [Methanothrix sp.]
MPALPGWLTFGDSIEGAIEMTKEAIELRLPEQGSIFHHL